MAAQDTNQVPAVLCQTNGAETDRRSAGFHPSIWGDYFLKYASESSEIDATTEQEVQKLKEEVKSMLGVAATKPSQSLELIDTIQRLGFSYHFEDEIAEILSQAEKIGLDEYQEDDLHSVSLWFRLLRQEGYNISSDIFKKFTNNEGKFKDDLKSDFQGMLSLYEASHLMVHGESILEEALAFTTAHLKSSATSSDLSTFLAAQVKHALNQPMRKGLPRVETRHFISIYHEDPSHSEVLLRFAKLDFNIVQKLHRRELCDATRWWKDWNFESKLSYARNRLVECYFWVVGIYFEPKYSLARRILTKVISIVSLIDDTYDVYGTIEELQILTDAVHRWDMSCLDQLPEYMKHLYKPLLVTYEEIEELLADEPRESYRIRHAKEIMKKSVQAYFDEAIWFNKKYVPTVEEYLELAFVTCGYWMLTVTSFVGMGSIATEEAFDWASKFPKSVRAASAICRLMDDVAGHKFEQKRGHVASSIECYIRQHGVTEEEAYNKFRMQIADSWKDINEECLEPRDVPMPLLMRVVNLARVMDVLYKDGDNYTHAGGIMKDFINSIFINPIPM